MCARLVEHEHGISEPHMRPRQAAVIVLDTPFLFEPEGLKKECPGSVDVLVAEQ